MTENFDRFEELKHAAAEALGLPPDADRPSLVAALRLALERMVEALAAGRHVDMPALTKTVELLDRFVPVPIPDVQITIVGAGGVPISELPYADRPPDDDPPPVPPSPPDRPRTEDDRNPAAPVTAASNIVQLPPPARRHVGSIQDQVGAGTGPASYAFCTGSGGSNPFSAIGEHPDFERHHSLPPIPKGVVW